MYAFAPEFTGDQVLQAFRRDGPSLFLGALIMAEGLVAAAFYTLRGRSSLLVAAHQTSHRFPSGRTITASALQLHAV